MLSTSENLGPVTTTTEPAATDGGPTRMAKRATKGDVRQHFSEEDKERLAAFLTALEAFKEQHPTMSVQAMISFLLVALDEGNKGVRDYASEAGVAQTVMTRHLLDLGDRNRHFEPGLGLVVQRNDPLDMRRTQTFLSEKGVALGHRLLRAVRQILK